MAWFRIRGLGRFLGYVATKHTLRNAKQALGLTGFGGRNCRNSGRSAHAAARRVLNEMVAVWNQNSA